MKNKSTVWTVFSKKCLLHCLAAGMLSATLFPRSPAQSAPAPPGYGGGFANGGPDRAAIDLGVDPCQDFYQYACGRWLKQNTIPPDQASWGRFSGFFSDNELLLRSIMEDAEHQDRGRTRGEQLVGDYYGACMNEAALEKRSLASLQGELQAMGPIGSKLELTQVLAKLHSNGVQALFTTRSRPGLANSSFAIAEIDAGGTSLPGRDYYLLDGSEQSRIREKYLEHLARVFGLAGDDATEAAIEAKAVLRIETLLARASLDPSARRDPKNLDHMKSVEELRSLVPSILWPEFFRTVGISGIQQLNVAEPDFFSALNSLLETEPRNLLRSYLRWRVIDFFSPVLSEDFAIENFNFEGKILNGENSIEPRWRRCVGLVNEQLADAVGQMYVTRVLQSTGKTQVLKIMETERSVLASAIGSSPWLSAETKRNAVAKLDAIILRIGYPDHWRDYSSVRVDGNNLFQSFASTSKFIVHHEFERIGRTVSSDEWTMSPQTIDASYRLEDNTMNFPAGILRPPFYDNTADLAVKFGAIGVVIGHELTHGFDDEGRKFDLHGSLHDWWTDADSNQFNQRAQCFVDEYNDVEVLPGLKANGKLTLGENIADNVGVRLAYLALEEETKGSLGRPGPDGFTPAQRFFLTYAQIWCQNMSEAYIRKRTVTNEHSLPPARVNGVVQNMPEFAAAFSCTPGSRMVHRPACRIW